MDDHQPYGDEPEPSRDMTRFPRRLRIVGALICIPSTALFQFIAHEGGMQLSLENWDDAYASASLLLLFGVMVTSFLQLLGSQLAAHVLTLMFGLLTAMTIYVAVDAIIKEQKFWETTVIFAAIILVLFFTQLACWLKLRCMKHTGATSPAGP